MHPEEINKLIRNRRSVFPQVYNDQAIPKEIIEEILENANWAPTHKLTEPWRFKVITGASLAKLGDFLAEAYKNLVSAEQFSEIKYKKTKKKARKCACVLAICMQRDPEERIPEWEEICSVACAVQNMWLSATAYGIGAYWSSPKTIEDAGSFLQLNEDERCLGFLYMGYYDKDNIDLKSKRNPIAEKVTWMD